MLLEEDQTEARLGQRDENIDPPEAREFAIPPESIATQVRPGAGSMVQRLDVSATPNQREKDKVAREE